jgi:hypothetical protein
MLGFFKEYKGEILRNLALLGETELIAMADSDDGYDVLLMDENSILGKL